MNTFPFDTNSLIWALLVFDVNLLRSWILDLRRSSSHVHLYRSLTIIDYLRRSLRKGSFFKHVSLILEWGLLNMNDLGTLLSYWLVRCLEFLWNLRFLKRELCLISSLNCLRNCFEWIRKKLARSLLRKYYLLELRVDSHPLRSQLIWNACVWHLLRNVIASSKYWLEVVSD